MLGIDDGTPRAQAPADGDVPDVAPADAIADVTGIPFPTIDGAAPPPGCEQLTADPARGVFVVATGADGPTCGTLAAPCATVQGGIDRAHDSSASPNVYVASGSYVEAVRLKAGVNVIGGWTPGASAWTRECSQLATVLVAPASEAVTVRAESIGGEAKLSTLTVASKAPADVKPGESLVGVLATGSGTKLAMVWVDVATSAAGAGLPGVAGDAGVSPATPCDASAPGDGASFGDLDAQGAPADTGTFGPTGYVASNGAAGPSGASGENGTAGTKATCAPCAASCAGNVPNCSVVPGTPLCGSPGQPGCGGGGGGGGAGGTGGGTSVALYAWDAVIDLTSCVLESGNGGNGGHGGSGASGGIGSGGAAGANSATCNTGCGGLLGLACSENSPDAGQGGGTGGPGGSGASGGNGGDGAGGDSFAYVEGGNAKVTIDTDTGKNLFFGAAGDGGVGAPGKSGPKGP